MTPSSPQDTTLPPKHTEHAPPTQWMLLLNSTLHALIITLPRRPMQDRKRPFIPRTGFRVHIRRRGMDFMSGAEQGGVIMGLFRGVLLLRLVRGWSE